MPLFAPAIGLLLAAISAHPSFAQSFPTRAVTLVVPYAPGGNVDISTRILQAAIGNALGAKRSTAVPDVPTIGEAGFPEVQGITFNGLFAPKATPAPVVERPSTVIRGALQNANAIEKLASRGSEARGSTPAEFAAFLTSESAKWVEVMKQANIKVTE